MNIEYKVIDENLKDLDKVSQIADEAFPDFNRSSVNIFIQIHKSGDGFSYACYDGDLLLGFIVAFIAGKYVYLSNFAIDKNLRGQGYGSLLLTDIISIIKKDNPGCAIVIDVEYPYPEAQNLEQRKSRISFYERLNFYLTDRIFDFHNEKYIHMVLKEHMSLINFDEFDEYFVPLSDKYNI